MESLRIRHELKTFREKYRFICYLDETRYDSNVASSVEYVKLPFLFQGHYYRQHIIIAHAGSESGWVREPYIQQKKNIKSSCVDHEDMTADLFENWFTNKLLPFLLPPTIIIIDNASYHSQRYKSSISLDISTFLEENSMYDEITLAQHIVKQQYRKVMMEYLTFRLKVRSKELRML